MSTYHASVDARMAGNSTAGGGTYHCNEDVIADVGTLASWQSATRVRLSMLGGGSPAKSGAHSSLSEDADGFDETPNFTAAADGWNDTESIYYATPTDITDIWSDAPDPSSDTELLSLMGEIALVSYAGTGDPMCALLVGDLSGADSTGVAAGGLKVDGNGAQDAATTHSVNNEFTTGADASCVRARVLVPYVPGTDGRIAGVISHGRQSDGSAIDSSNVHSGSSRTADPGDQEVGLCFMSLAADTAARKFSLTLQGWQHPRLPWDPNITDEELAKWTKVVIPASTSPDLDTYSVHVSTGDPGDGSFNVTLDNATSSDNGYDGGPHFNITPTGIDLSGEQPVFVAGRLTSSGNAASAAIVWHPSGSPADGYGVGARYTSSQHGSGCWRAGSGGSGVSGAGYGAWGCLSANVGESGTKYVGVAMCTIATEEGLDDDNGDDQTAEVTTSYTGDLTMSLAVWGNGSGSGDEAFTGEFWLYQPDADDDVDVAGAMEVA